MDPAFFVVKLQTGSWPSGYILVVDDNEDTRDAFQALLEAWGYTVKTADCGQRGLELARVNYPSAAFIDLNMPGMSGYELAAQLRKLNPYRTKLFAVSAYISETANNKLFDDLFQKPVNLDLIWKLLRALSSTD
jgi:CheY-like chemotaxis protein